MSKFTAEAEKRIRTDYEVKTPEGEFLIEKVDADASSRAAAYAGRFVTSSDKK